MITCITCNTRFREQNAIVIKPNSRLVVQSTTPIKVLNRFNKAQSATVRDSRDIPRDYGLMGCPSCHGIILRGT